MIDQRIFEDLQNKIDEETTVRDVSRLPAPARRSYRDFFHVPSLRPLRTTTVIEG